MAAIGRGAREAFGIGLAVAESGIASPPQRRERPGGLYYIGLVADGFERVERYEFADDRVETMRQPAPLSSIGTYLESSPEQSGERTNRREFG